MMNFGNYIFLNGSSLIDESDKYHHRRMPRAYGKLDGVVYVDFDNPILVNQNMQPLNIPGKLVCNLNGKVFIAKRENTDGYFIINWNGEIGNRTYDEIFSHNENMIIFKNRYFVKGHIKYTYTIVNENGVIWEDDKLPDELFITGYYILKDKITTGKFSGISLEILYDNVGVPIYSTIKGDAKKHYENIKDMIAFKKRELNSETFLRDYIKKQLISLGLGTMDDSIADMIIEANSHDLLLVVSLENGKVLAYKMSENQELIDGNNMFLKRLRSEDE